MTRNVRAGTPSASTRCFDAPSMATDMQKYMAVHNTCRTFAAIGHVMKQELRSRYPEHVS
jgi:hypothetical protein